MSEKWPQGYTEELLELLDRIEIEDDASLASQRFIITEKYGMKVVVLDSVGGQTQ